MTIRAEVCVEVFDDAIEAAYLMYIVYLYRENESVCSYEVEHVNMYSEKEDEEDGAEIYEITCRKTGKIVGKVLLDEWEPGPKTEQV